MKKILYLDMDGVIADFDHAIKVFVPDLHTADYSSTSHKVDAICEASPDIFHTLRPIDGAVESVIELFDLFDVYFLSTPMWNVPQSFTGKRIWLETHFGELAEKRLILTHRKDLNVGHFLVDDSVRNGVDRFSGEHIHFGTEKFLTWKVTLPYLKAKAIVD